MKMCTFLCKSAEGSLRDNKGSLFTNKHKQEFILSNKTKCYTNKGSMPCLITENTNKNSHYPIEKIHTNEDPLIWKYTNERELHPIKINKVLAYPIFPPQIKDQITQKEG